MAFYRSKVLSHVQKYATSSTNPTLLNPENLKYDPERYGQMYSSKAATVGYEEEGRRFLSRMPRYRGIHPEILDAINAQRLALFFWCLGCVFFGSHLWESKVKNDQRFWHALFKDKEFVGRYSYKQKDVEYSPRIQTRYHN